jgi:hypothetical protein
MKKLAAASSVALLAGGLAFGASVAGAAPVTTSIDFEVDIPDGEGTTGANQYESLGLTISGAVGIIAGVSQGDPGGWELEGPDGPQFVGQNDASTQIAFDFATPIEAFSIQCAGSGGSSPGQAFAVVAYDADSEPVDLDEGTTGDVDEWSTFSVSGPDIVSVEVGRPGGTTGFAPFGCDALVFTADVPEPTTTTTSVAPTTTVAPSPTSTSTTAADQPQQDGARRGAQGGVVTPRFTG